MHNIRKTSIRVNKSITEFLELTNYMYQLKNYLSTPFSHSIICIYNVFIWGENPPFQWSTALKLNHPLWKVTEWITNTWHFPPTLWDGTSMVHDVAYKICFGVTSVKVSCRGIIRVIFQKGVHAITLVRGQQAVYRPFHTWMPRNLSVPSHD